jgi:hypothetical protein
LSGKTFSFQVQIETFKNRKNNAKKKSKLKLAPVQPCSNTKKNS